MQGIMGCYIKSNSVLSSSAMKILDKMHSTLGNNNLVDVERTDFQNFSLSVLSHNKTPYAFKPLRFTVNKKHMFIDGFIKNKRSFLSVFNNKNDDINLLSLTQYSGIYNAVSYDEKNNELLIINDRHGARYLYYYDDEDCFIFAPFTKCILSSGLV